MSKQKRESNKETTVLTPIVVWKTESGQSKPEDNNEKDQRHVSHSNVVDMTKHLPHKGNETETTVAVRTFESHALPHGVKVTIVSSGFGNLAKSSSKDGTVYCAA